MAEIYYNLKPDGISEVVDEGRGNSFIALKELKWGDNGKYHLDLRKWYVKSDGTEFPGKGVSFQTEEGPHSLTKIMLENGYGHSKDVLMAIKDREDIPTEIKDSIESNIDKMNIDSTDEDVKYYDPGELFKNE